MRRSARKNDEGSELTKDTTLEVQQDPWITDVHWFAEDVDRERMRNRRTTVKENQE